jgi:hypothetical protein
MDWMRVAAFVLVLLLILAAGLCYSLLAGTDETVDGEADPYQSRPPGRG